MGPLTDHRAKPALPFAGHFRLIDFPLSNCANSVLSDVWVLEQYRPHSIEDHLANGRPWDLDRTQGGLLILHPFTGGEGEGFTEGNADALWRHRELIGQFGPDVVLVLSADGVYTLDYRDVIAAHLERDADVTMVTTTVDEDAGRFGVVSVDGEHRVTDFAYKPDDPQSDVVTIEVFAYRSSVLLETLEELGNGDKSLDDFGDALLPRLVEGGKAFDFPLPGYWRDVGTPESYWQAHQDLVDGTLDLDDLDWPLRTTSAHRPPARVEGGSSVEDSLLSPACRVAGRVRRSVLSPGVVVEPGAEVVDSVILHGALIRAGARVEKAVVDSKVDVPGGADVHSGDPENPVMVLGQRGE